MSQFEVLKAKHLQARKDKNDIAKNLYAYLIGQATKKEKEPVDEDLFETYKAYLKSMTLQNLTGEAKVVFDQEAELVNALLPLQLSTLFIEQKIKDIIAGNETAKKNFGLVMSYFKANHSGQFNPGDVRSLWTSITTS